MNTIVMNTRSGAVTEYAGFGFQAITPTHLGSATGLFAIGGNTDDGAKIVASIKTSKPMREDTRKKYPSKVFVAIKGSGTFRVTVYGEKVSYSYPTTAAPAGVASAKPGRGIRENYLAYGFSNPAGQDFRLDYIEALLSTSQTRRV